jgi:hypothetical protein
VADPDASLADVVELLQGIAVLLQVMDARLENIEDALEANDGED